MGPRIELLSFGNGQKVKVRVGGWGEVSVHLKQISMSFIKSRCGKRKVFVEEQGKGQ